MDQYTHYSIPGGQTDSGYVKSEASASVAPSPSVSLCDTDTNSEELPLDKEEPYAKLIWRCLMEAPDHTMVLREIYEWFNEHTDKGKDPNVKGWQNSIRHNLSMNKVRFKFQF